METICEGCGRTKDLRHAMIGCCDEGVEVKKWQVVFGRRPPEAEKHVLFIAEDMENRGEVST